MSNPDNSSTTATSLSLLIEGESVGELDTLDSTPPSEESKSKSLQYKEIIVPIYGLPVVFCSPEGYEERFGEDPELEANMVGAVKEEHGCVIMLLTKEGLDVGTIAHECLHAAWSLLEVVGVPQDDLENQEALAYLLDYLVVEATEFYLGQ